MQAVLPLILHPRIGGDFRQFVLVFQCCLVNVLQSITHIGSKKAVKYSVPLLQLDWKIVSGAERNDMTYFDTMPLRFSLYLCVCGRLTFSRSLCCICR